MSSVITIFKDVNSKDPFYITIDKAFERIKNGQSKSLIEQIRLEPDKEKRNQLKAKLPSVLFSGKFKDRSDKSIEEHSTFVILDFDHIANAVEFKTEIFKEPFVRSVWISPSGDGVKALAKIKFPNKHREHYKSLLKYLEKYGVSPDEKNINSARVCYESFDPEILQKEEKEVTEYQDVIAEKVYQPKPITINSSPATDEEKIYNNLKKWISNRGELFVEGNRNNFLMKLASACNRTGISRDVAMGFLASDFLHGTEFSVKELQNILKSVYENYAHQHGIARFQENATGYNSQIVNKETKEILDEKAFEISMPVKDLIYFKDVYANLEERLKNGTVKGETTYFPILDDHFRWMRREVTIVQGFGNHGKSFLTLQLMLLKSIFCDYKWAVFNPENSPADFFYQDLVEMYLGKPLDKSFPNCATDEEREKGKEFVNEHFFYIYPKDDSPTPDYVLKRFIEVIIKHKIDGVLIDPYNQLIHDRQGNRDDLYLELFLNKVKRFAQNQDIFFLMCVHPNKPQRSGSSKVYDEPSMYDLAGGAMWPNKVDNILCLHRPNYFIDPKDTWCTFSSQKIKKQKLNGVPGKINFVLDRFKSRYFELKNEPIGGEIGYNPLEQNYVSQETQVETQPEPETDILGNIVTEKPSPFHNWTEPLRIGDENEDLGF